MSEKELEEFYRNANEEELLKYDIESMSFGNIPSANLSTCEVYGISGNCGSECPKFKDKTCEEYTDTLERIYNELQQENKQLKEQLQQRDSIIDKSYIRLQRLLDYYDHYKVLPQSILDELIELHKELDKYKGDNNE